MLYYASLQWVEHKDVYYFSSDFVLWTFSQECTKHINSIYVDFYVCKHIHISNKRNLLLVPAHFLFINILHSENIVFGTVGLNSINDFIYHTMCGSAIPIIKYCFNLLILQCNIMKGFIVIYITSLFHIASYKQYCF